MMIIDRKNKHHRLLLVSIFSIAIVLRIIFGFINSFSFDNHMEVIQIIKNENRIPIKADCWECFQPKLYHVFVAFVLKIFHIEANRLQTIIAQLINVIAGVITIYVVYLFLEKLHLKSKLKLFGFSLIALNPKLIGVNVQAANDSFVILFSTLSLYFIWLYVKYEKRKHFFLATLFTILANLSKGNGLILFFIIITVLIVKLYLDWNAHKLIRKTLVHLFLFLLLFLLIVPYFGQYIHKYLRYGSPFVISHDMPPRPPLFKEIPVEEVVPGMQSGVTSVVHSYLTFRFIDLLKNPLTIGDVDFGDNRPYPRHRTSLWTQLYGRTHFIHFNLWPPIVRVENKIIIYLGRFIFILALFPTLIFLYGLSERSWILLKSVIQKDIHYLKDPGWIFVISAAAYVLFIIIFSYRVRDYTSMKAIIIYPALLAFLYLFIKALNRLYKSVIKCQKICLFFDALLILLVSAYVLNVIILIYQLYFGV